VLALPFSSVAAVWLKVPEGVADSFTELCTELTVGAVTTPVVVIGEFTLKDCVLPG
jgi:hypothetical protein